jgi:hypothetical protein
VTTSAKSTDSGRSASALTTGSTTGTRREMKDALWVSRPKQDTLVVAGCCFSCWKKLGHNTSPLNTLVRGRQSGCHFFGECNTFWKWQLKSQGKGFGDRNGVSFRYL